MVAQRERQIECALCFETVTFPHEWDNDAGVCRACAHFERSIQAKAAPLTQHIARCRQAVAPEAGPKGGQRWQDT